MTLENWNSILFLCMRSSVPIFITVFFMISWIFIGNYVLLNLFLAILLDGFAKENTQKIVNELEDDDDEEEDAVGDGGEKVEESFSQVISSSDNRFSSSRISRSQPKKLSIIESAKQAALKLQDIFSKRRTILQEKNLNVDIPGFSVSSGDGSRFSKIKEKYKLIECENSWFLFPKKSSFRKFCFHAANHTMY